MIHDSEITKDNWAYQPQKGARPYLFLILAQPDKDGYSRKVYTSEFIDDFELLKMGGNGGSWCRSDSSLGNHYNITRKKENNSIIWIKLDGLKKKGDSKPIPPNIRKQIQKQRCAVLYTGNKTQADHKDGRRDDPKLNNIALVSIKDFQPLSQAANSAKRQHCKECRRTNKRFDATVLGYSVSQTKGGKKYTGSCVGCYWHNPFEFNKLTSEDYSKTV